MVSKWRVYGIEKLFGPWRIKNWSVELIDWTIVFCVRLWSRSVSMKFASMFRSLVLFHVSVRFCGASFCFVPISSLGAILCIREGLDGLKRGKKGIRLKAERVHNQERRTMITLTNTMFFSILLVIITRAHARIRKKTIIGWSSWIVRGNPGSHRHARCGGVSGTGRRRRVSFTRTAKPRFAKVRDVDERRKEDVLWRALPTKAQDREIFEEARDDGSGWFVLMLHVLVERARSLEPENVLGVQ